MKGMVLSMNKSLSASRRHPILFGIIVMVAFFLIMNIAGLLLSQFGPDFLLSNGDWVMQGACECITALAGIALAAVFKVWNIWGERGRGFGKGLLTSMYFIVVSLLALVESITLELTAPESNLEIEVPWKICVFVATVFLIGFTEETFFRGIIANLFYEKHATDKAGVWTAVIGSGFVFGLMHLGNCLSGIVVTANGVYFEPSIVVGALVQTASACVMGMALTAIYYRCRNIWALAFVHGFIDLCGAFTSGVTRGGSLVGTISTYTPAMFVSMIPYVILTLYLLRSKKMAEILEYRHSSYASQPSQPSQIDDELAQLSYSQSEPLTYTVDDAQTSDKTAFPYQKSKRSMNIAVAAATAITVALFAMSVSLYIGDGNTGDMSDMGEAVDYVFTYDSTDTCEDVPTAFDKDFGSFEVEESREYKFTITSYPGDSNANVTFYIRDSEENLIYAESYNGRCSYDFNLHLEEGESYNITAYYDFSLVKEKMSYVTKIKVG